MAFPLGAALTAGASLISSIFGGKKKNTVTTSHVDYKRLVRDAEAAGFNPLTALRNGGAAGFSVTSTSGGGAPLSSRVAEGVAGAMNVLGQSEDFLSNFDPHRDNMKEASYRHLLAQTENLEASTAAMLSQAAYYERRPSGGAAQLSKQGAALGAVTSVELDGFKYGGTGEGGAIEDMWVAYRRPDGSYVRTPNPNLPDGEQMFIPPMVAAENVITRPVLSQLDNKGWYQSRPLTEKEKRKIDESWLPSWVPRIRYQN